MTEERTICPQKIYMDQLLTLTDVQKILGDINWLRHSLKLSTKIWTPLFSILMGVMTPPFLESSHLRIKGSYN